MLLFHFMHPQTSVALKHEALSIKLPLFIRTAADSFTDILIACWLLLYL